ncbi:MAG: hypothetical protein JWN33_324 [Candidatus Saccharibacteria bacterium]|nr:hypothetical protein [Candidatus Saccharibacteria bacterium]
MNKITKQSIDELIDVEGEELISIYLPTHRYPTPPHMQEDQTRLKNLVREAQRMIDPDSIMQSALHDILDKVNETQLWHRTTEGLAIFSDGETIQLFSLPIECEEHVFVGEHYDIAPLIAVLSYDQPYYLLCLAMHNSKLFKGDVYGLQPVAIDFPKSPEDALNIDELFSNSHTQRSNNKDSRRSNNAVSPHGQGDSREAGGEERMYYFRQIEAMIKADKEYDADLPLVVAATESEAGDFRAFSSLNICDQFIHGNVTHLSTDELHHQAWAIIESTKSEDSVEAVQTEFEASRGADRFSDQPLEIEKAAEEGRVSTLAVQLLIQSRDSVRDVIRDAVPMIRFGLEYEKYDIAKIVSEVYRRGGTILASANSYVLGSVPLAASMRY